MFSYQFLSNYGNVQYNGLVHIKYLAASSNTNHIFENLMLEHKKINARIAIQRYCIIIRFLNCHSNFLIK